MASDLSNGHVPPRGDLPFMKLPEHIDGFIDVETLIDIHKYLGESEKSEDVALAVWVEKNYLQEPLAETGRPIRDSEGFVNLDKAYRRVRQLTGKAQDKWPFFDKNWKKMSSMVVKNAILGDAAMGTAGSDTNSEVRDTPMSNGFDSQRDYVSQIPRLQVSFGTNEFSGYQMQEQKSPQPAAPSLADQQEPEQRAHRQAPHLSPASKASSVSESAARNENEITSALDGTANGTTPPVDAWRDAGAGKMRGPHGRYVNKSKPSPAAKKGLNIKWVKKSRTRAALEGESEEEASLSDEGVQAPKTIHDLASGPSSDGNGEDIQSSSLPPTDVKINDTTFEDFPVSAILAAEAEAVPSNLDRLPPGLVHKKRKSESNIQRGGTKRARGSRGGVLGRPRKSETLAERAQLEAGGSVEVNQAPSQTEALAKAPTRRSSRKSVASAMESSTPWDPADDVLLNGSGQKQPAANNTDIAVDDGDLLPNGDHRTTAIPSSVDQKTKAAISETTRGTVFTIPTNIPASQALKTQKSYASSKQKKRVSFSPEIQADNLEFFARISTTAGTQEVPLSEEDLTSEVDLVKRYAAWQNAGNAHVTFEVFKNIVKFAR
ncbi:hypothetical protein BU25DRAFT_3693 [Macroventuria anomochaeta]|uniref:Uncharacterized protein n=1 Tax=Macroventuria anomochaeta TaxID=301207 RepID=A0ACB6SIY6_9PLEO|nr:uncharacterized protein BU25DRAFT_3693 [Macroventuria anomochaeta]KAF2633314.1 hypothetical protein BU25DRAFT_3693 [Macroventuria anomochaeta]